MHLNALLTLWRPADRDMYLGCAIAQSFLTDRWAQAFISSGNTYLKRLPEPFPSQSSFD